MYLNKQYKPPNVSGLCVTVNLNISDLAGAPLTDVGARLADVGAQDDGETMASVNSCLFKD